MNSQNHKVSLKKPSDFFEHKRNEVLEKELAQKKIEEENKLKNKKFAYPKELFGEDRVVVENIIEEEIEIEESKVDPYLEEFTLLKGDLKRVASSIPDRTDLTEVFNEINNLKKRLNNIPEYDGHLALIRTEIAELENSINDLPTIPEEFDPSDLYENITTVKNTLKDKIQEVRSEIPIVPEVRYYEDDLDDIRELVEGVKNSIPVVPEVRYYEDDLDAIIETIDSVKQTISELPEVKYYDEEVTAIAKRFNEIQKTIEELPEVKYYDKPIKEIHEVILEIREEIPTVPEVKYYDKDVKELKEKISSVEKSIPTVPEVKYYDEDINVLNQEIKELYEKVTSIKVPDQNKYIQETKNLQLSFEQRNQKLIKKINHLEEVFEKFNEKALTEGLLNIPPDVDNSDPLTPLDKDYATQQDLSKAFKLLTNRIQTQLSTLGGGGETRFQYLDDVVGIATNLSSYDGQFLKVDTSLSGPYKFKFADPAVGAGGTWAITSVGINTTKNVGIGTTAKAGYALDVEGNARVTGILTVGRSTITLNPNTDIIQVGTGITLDATNSKILVSGNEIADSSGNANYSGIITATTLSATTGNFSGNVTIGGTLTYEDVTNIDVVGFATITKGIEVQGTGSTTTTLNVTGVSTFAGIGTFGSDVYIDGDLNVTGDISYDEVSGKNLLVTGITTLSTLGVSVATTSKDLKVTGVTTLTGYVYAEDRIYTDQIRRYSDSGTTTKINLGDEVIKIFAGNASNEVLNIQSGVATVTGELKVSTDVYAIGVITATTFKGNLTGDVTGDITGDVTGSIDTGYAVISGVTASKTSTSIASVDTFSASQYRSANYQIQVVRGTNYNMTTINILHDGTNTYMTEFGTINQPVGIATFGSDINSGNVRLLATPTSSDATVFNITRTLTKVAG